MKPSTALLKDNKDFFYPDFTHDLHYEAELVLKISKQGKHIEREFAHRYYEEVTVGVDFTARDLQSELKGKGLPWEKAKAFDQSAVIGSWKKWKDLQESSNIRFSLDKNGQTVQEAESRLMITDFAGMIAEVSQYFTLQAGDLLFTGTPAGVGPVQKGDVLSGKLEGEEVFRFRIC
jgi:2-keto-4-pentenoate hydratase/2-oxohepta-3-ene-1,7-dioic acid hydratase in catechol pathway